MNNYEKWNYAEWSQNGKINLSGSHSDHVWAQALTHLASVYKQHKFVSIADIGCGVPPLDIQNIPPFHEILDVVRVDGSSQVEQSSEYSNSIIICNLNKDKIPIDDKAVDFSISFEVIEHLYSTYGFLEELARISKYGFLISKPNTDHMGLSSKWYGEKYFFATEIPLFDSDKRYEHINFIPNYELFGFAKILNMTCRCLDDFEEEIQFFLFLHNT